jgi:hypothetical protein
MGEYETSGNYNQEEDMDNNEHQEENDDYENFENFWIASPIIDQCSN